MQMMAVVVTCHASDTRVALDVVMERYFLRVDTLIHESFQLDSPSCLAVLRFRSTQGAEWLFARFGK